tara:strand:- start:196 stop:438 length:243 start_codon:yes stop_codon:yes gene_type:complete
MGTSTRSFTFWRDENDLVKPITDKCEIVTIPFRSNLGPEIISKVMKTDKFEILGIQEDGTWTMEIVARKIDEPIYVRKGE